MGRLQGRRGPGISIHALLAESDTLSLNSFPNFLDFNPRSPCGERPSSVSGLPQIGQISIHALLAESDPANSGNLPFKWISIHALLAESDHICCHKITSLINFNPRSPCGERHPSPGSSPGPLPNFNPRSPCGERLGDKRPNTDLRQISIHALLAESDQRCRDWRTGSYYFNPRSPCGERPKSGRMHPADYLFQSTLSLRRATGQGIVAVCVSDDFNPRSPCGERPDDIATESTIFLFQSTLSLRRATANTTKLALSFLSKVPI